MVEGKLTLRQGNRLIYKRLGIPISKADEWLKKDKQLVLEYVEPINNRKEVLLKLRKMGMKVAILSDTIHPLKWRVELLNKLGLRKGKHYDKIFLSNIIGHEKPHPKAYLTVLKFFKVKPEEAIFVGHDKEEVEGAKKLGIKTISFSSLEKQLDKL